MRTYPDTFAFVQMHINDAYATSWGNTRFNFYQCTGYPTSIFDGVLKRVGAQSYTTYQNDYLNRRAVPTDFTIELTGVQTGNQQFDITARVCREGTGSGQTVRVYIVHVLDNWPVYGGYHRNGLRQAAPTTDISVAGGQCVDVVESFVYDAISWNEQEDMKMIAWVQEPRSVWPADIHQGAILNWPFGGPIEPSEMPWPEDSLGLSCTEKQDCGEGATDCVEGVCYVPKNRYMSIAANPANTGISSARRVHVTLTARAIQLGWIGVPEFDPVSGLWTALIQGWPPVYSNSEGGDGFEGDWPDVLHVKGCEIVPGKTYLIDAITYGMNISDPDNYSTQLPLITSPVWGDVVGQCPFDVCEPPQGDPGTQPDIDDVLASVRAFTGTTNAPLTWMDVDPVVDYGYPEGQVVIGDVLAIVVAFTGGEYSGFGPFDCD
jgi:hypothetical protein